MNDDAPLIRLRGIARRFGSVQALRGADFACGAGEIHALLGENGAGKSTLMHILFGMQRPDAGDVELKGRAVRFRSPADAMAAGLGMVHQHFTQVPRMTVAENVWLGRPGWRFDRDAAREAVHRAGEFSGLRLDADAVAGDLPVGLRQRLEIVKALSRDVRALILDEPTGALVPTEVDELFAALRRLRSAGVAVILITHKLREVAAVADRVTVMRQGEVALSGTAADYDGAALARAMIGDPSETARLLEEDVPPRRRAPARYEADAPPSAAPALRVEGLRVRGKAGLAVRGASLEVRAGEIVGVAAVEGNGQRELLRAVAGLAPYQGTVTVRGAVGFVPEDRQQEGLILDFTVAENLALGRTRGWWMNRPRLAEEAANRIAAFDIRGAAPERAVRLLSGGNQQKVVLARALASRPTVLVAENPTRGLDVHATLDLHERLRRAAREDGLAVLVSSTDLDEVLALADRVGVMHDGHWSWVPEGERSRSAVGALMLGRSA